MHNHIYITITCFFCVKSFHEKKNKKYEIVSNALIYTTTFVTIELLWYCAKDTFLLRIFFKQILFEQICSFFNRKNSCLYSVDLILQILRLAGTSIGCMCFVLIDYPIVEFIVKSAESSKFPILICFTNFLHYFLRFSHF